VEECGTLIAPWQRSMARRPEASGCMCGYPQTGPTTLPAFEDELGGDRPFADRLQGASTSRLFETYLQKVLAASLKEGQVVLMDNL
jgi:hypothetical protein